MISLDHIISDSISCPEPDDSNLGALAGLCAGAIAKSWPATNFLGEWQM